MGDQSRTALDDARSHASAASGEHQALEEEVAVNVQKSNFVARMRKEKAQYMDEYMYINVPLQDMRELELRYYHLIKQDHVLDFNERFRTSYLKYFRLTKMHNYLQEREPWFYLRVMQSELARRSRRTLDEDRGELARRSRRTLDGES